MLIESRAQTPFEGICGHFLLLYAKVFALHNAFHDARNQTIKTCKLHDAPSYYIIPTTTWPTDWTGMKEIHGYAVFKQA